MIIFWKKTVAGLLALVIVSGATPIQPVIDLLGSTSITARAEDAHNVSVTFDLGADHEAFAQKYIDKEGCSVSGSCVTLTVSAETEADVYTALWSLVSGTDDSQITDNGQLFFNVGKKPLNEYSGQDEFYAELSAAQDNTAGGFLTLYALWQKPVADTYSVVFTSPPCGTKVTISNYGSIATDHSVPTPTYTLNGESGEMMTNIRYDSYDSATDSFGDRSTQIHDENYTSF